MKKKSELEDKLSKLTKIYKKGRVVIPYCSKNYENCFKDQNCYYYKELEVKYDNRKS
jgi:hypothetical protein